MVLFVKSMIFTLLVPGFVAVLAPMLIAEEAGLNGSEAIIFGSLFLFAGFTVYCWCVWDFVAFGRGTPAPIDPPKNLVVRGLYRYTRNPMYVGVLIIVLGWTFIFSESTMILYWFFLGSGFQLIIVHYEEPLLQKHFGLTYLEYKTSVNRWLPDFCL